MPESLFSPLWHRYAKQRPQLRSHVSVQSQQYRDQTWHLLINDTKGDHFRINDTAYQFIGRCDGRYSVQDIWKNLLETLGDDALTQDEVIQLLNDLDKRDLVRYEVQPNILTMFRQKKEHQKRQLLSTINPLAFKLPLWNPSKFLDRLPWLPKLIINPYTLLLWLAVLTTGFISAGANWHTLTQHASNYMMTPHYLFLTWLSFPFIKFLHELGHAIAVRNWGGQVTETGITLFMLIPAPYVDASASNAFRNKYQRMLVSAIGIMIELFLAGLALFVWFSTQPGIVHDLAFVCMFICSISTLLFNGNPLLRFDAYYILSDAFELPNLAIRSKQYWVNLIKKIMLGANKVNAMSLALGEEKWLVAYAPLSLAYMLTIVSFIILWVGKQSATLAFLLAIFSITTIILIPIYKTIKNILSSMEAGPDKTHAKLLMATGLLVATIFLFVLPAPYSKTAQGVIWTPEQAQIRPSTEGFIKQIHVKHDQIVEANQLILTLEDDNLIAARNSLMNQIAGMRADQYNLIFQDPVRANNITQQIERAIAELTHIEGRINSLNIRSLVKGRLVMPHQEDILGTFVERGATLGYILNQDIIKVRAAIPASDTALIQERLQQTEVRTAENPNQTIITNIGVDTPAVTHTLPSAAMGNTAGGHYVTDPSDKNGLKSIEPLVLIDISLPKTALKRVGGRVNVRFDLGSEPIGMQLLHHVSQLFLRYFNPTE